MSNNIYQAISFCRLCGSKNLEPLFDFGNVSLANDLVKVGENRKSLESPLVVVRCEDCFAVQLKHTVDPIVLFKNYSYLTPPNFDSHFKEYAKTVSSHLKLKKGEPVIEIGGNTGLLCSHFKKLGYDPINVEPCLQIANIAREKGIKIYHGFFDKQTARRLKGAHTGIVKLIVATNVLAHVDLDVVMEGVKEILHDDGILVMENAYLPKSIEHKDMFQVYAEHLHYHLLTPLKTYFLKYNLNLYHVEFNDVQLGSFRAYIGKRKDDQTIIKALEQEKKYTNNTVYKEFWRDMNIWRNKIKYILHTITSGNNNNIAIYGVPAKLVLLLKFIDFEGLKYAIDDSPSKINKLVPGTNIEIKSSDYFKKNPPEYCFLGAYNFKDDIIKKHNWYKGLWLDPLKLQFH